MAGVERERGPTGRLRCILAGSGTFHIPLKNLVESTHTNIHQRQKVYVQDLIRQQSSLIYNALAIQDGIVYICGSSGKMPQAVREALIEGFQNHGAMGREAAEAYLVAMEKSGRYKQETW